MRTRLLIAAAAALLTALAPAPVLAQDVQTDGQRLPSFSTLITIDFPGGTLPEFAESFKDAANGPVNFVFRQESAQFRVPAIKLEQVALKNAVDIALTRIAPISVTRDGIELDGHLGYELVQQDVRSAPVIVADVLTAAPFRTSFNPVRLTFDISDLASDEASRYTGIRLDTIASAIDQMLSLGTDNPPDIEYGFHPETSLMIVLAPNPDTADEIRQLVEQLRNQAFDRTRFAAAERRLKIQGLITALESESAGFESDTYPLRNELNNNRDLRITDQMDEPMRAEREQLRDQIQAQLDVLYDQMSVRRAKIRVLSRYADLLNGDAPPLTALRITQDFREIASEVPAGSE